MRDKTDIYERTNNRNRMESKSTVGTRIANCERWIILTPTQPKTAWVKTNGVRIGGQNTARLQIKQ